MRPHHWECGAEGEGGEVVSRWRQEASCEPADKSFQALERGGRGSNDCPAVRVRLRVGWGRGGALQHSGFVRLTHISILLSEENTLNKPFDDNKHGYLPVFRIQKKKIKVFFQVVKAFRDARLHLEVLDLHVVIFRSFFSN